MRVLAGALALSVAACAGGPSKNTLSFAQMQSLNPGVDADWIRDEYPFAGSVQRWPDGAIRSMRYPVTDPMGKARSVTLVFDQRGVLTEKRYSGEYVRPPAEPAQPPGHIAR
jgi:hypothetical protein